MVGLGHTEQVYTQLNMSVLEADQAVNIKFYPLLQIFGGYLHLLKLLSNLFQARYVHNIIYVYKVVDVPPSVYYLTIKVA